MLTDGSSFTGQSVSDVLDLLVPEDVVVESDRLELVEFGDSFIDGEVIP